MRSALISLVLLILAACSRDGGATPIGDRWFFGSTVALVAIAAGVCVWIYRSYADKRRSERRDERREDRKP